MDEIVKAPSQITVVFSCYNGGERLRGMLDSLVAQDLPAKNWTVVAVDNNSSDDTFVTLDSYREKLPITVLRYAVPGKSAALNFVLQHVTGELIVLTDDDVIADPGWLSAMVACAAAHPEFGVFGGRIIPDWERDPKSQAFLAWIPMGSTFAVVDEGESGPCDPGNVWGPNTAVRRSLFTPEVRFREDIGPRPGGKYPMGQDSEFVLRLARRGVKSYHCAEAVVHHFVPASSMTEDWVQKRAERLGLGMPAIFPGDVPRGFRIAGVPVAIWAQSANWALRRAVLYPLPNSRLRFWAIWKHYYMRGYRAGIRRFGPEGLAR